MPRTEMPADNTRRESQAPTVSVIIPAYNIAQYIGETLASVCAQTFDDYEVIVVNDGSPDTVELEKVLAPYRDRIIYLTQENRGPSSARNTAIRAARGRFIALLDGDDWWEPDYLAVQVAALEGDPSIDVVYPDALIFGDAAEAGRKYTDLCPSEGEVTFERLLTQQCNVMVSVTARREALMRAGLFDETLRCSEDFDLWLRIARQGGRFAYHGRVLVHYRKRRGSLSSDPVWICENILKVMEKTGRTLSLDASERETLKREQARVHALLRFNQGKRAFTRGDAQKAIDDLREANAFFKSRKTSLALLLLRFAPRALLRAYHLRDRYILKADTKF